LWTRPHVHVGGAPPSFADRCATAFLKAATIAAFALPSPCPEAPCSEAPGPDAPDPGGPAKTGLDGSPSVQDSRSSSSGNRPDVTARPKWSPLTGTFAA